jgi:hypothetical protein
MTYKNGSTLMDVICGSKYHAARAQIGYPTEDSKHTSGRTSMSLGASGPKYDSDPSGN